MIKLRAFLREIPCLAFWHDWGEFIPSTSIEKISSCGGDRYRAHQQCRICGETRYVHFTVPRNP